MWVPSMCCSFSERRKPRPGQTPSDVFFAHPSSLIDASSRPDPPLGRRCSRIRQHAVRSHRPRAMPAPGPRRDHPRTQSPRGAHEGGANAPGSPGAGLNTARGGASVATLRTQEAAERGLPGVPAAARRPSLKPSVSRRPYMKTLIAGDAGPADPRPGQPGPVRCGGRCWACSPKANASKKADGISPDHEGGGQEARPLT